MPTINQDPLLSLKNPWSSNANLINLGFMTGVRRNIEKFKFPGRLNLDSREQILNIASQELLKSTHLKNPTFYRASDLDPLKREYIYEHFLTQSSFHEAHKGEGVVVDETGCFLATINLKDHLYLQMTDTSGELEKCWNRLSSLETSIGNNVAYSFSNKFGFLTADPCDCGTALSVWAFLHVPALIHTKNLEEFLVKHRDDSISVHGLQGTVEEMIGDLLIVHNNYMLGLTEENILSSIRSFSTKLVVHEKSARSHLREEENINLKDMVSRSFGLLTHSYKLEVSETLNAISLLKLGHDLGWVSNIEIANLNALFFNCRRAHLLSLNPEGSKEPQVSHFRASYIHQALKNTTLSL